VRGLSNADLRRLIDGVAELHAEPSLDRLPGRVTSLLHALLRADSTSYTEVDPRRRYLLTVMDPPDEELVRRLPFFRRFAHQHPVIRYMQTTGDGRARTISDFLSDGAYRELALYREFYGPVHVNHQLAASLRTPPATVIAMVANRERGDFRRRERELFDVVRPHFVRAWENAAALARVDAERRCFGEALEGSRLGVIRLTRAGGVRHANRRARALVAAVCGTPLRRRLPDDVRARVRDALTPALDAVGPIDLGSGRRRVRLRVLRGLPDDGTLVVLEETAPAPSPALLRAIGLSGREAEVLFRVAHGWSSADVAVALGTSVRTVDKHLERIYRRLDVHSRAAAVACALEALGALPAGDAAS
jgi:DNA-binding CsgD family transcriptional regulator